MGPTEQVHTNSSTLPEDLNRSSFLNGVSFRIPDNEQKENKK
jgi:hypothetical protein